MLHDPTPMALTLEDLDRIGAGTPGHRVRGPARQAPMLEGRFQLAQAPTGIQIHATDVLELEDFEVSFTAPAGLKLLVQLGGTSQFEIAGQMRRLCAAQGPMAELFWLPEPTQITRLCRAGTRVRKLMLTVAADWFDGMPGQEALQAAPQGACRWVPGPKALAAAEQLVAMEKGAGIASQFERDRAALRLLQDGVAQWEAPRGAAPARASERDKLQAAENYIAAHLHPGLTTAEVARAVGVSERVLERLFRRHRDQTLGAYRRDLGLSRARAALEQDGVSVAEAARLAGYGNPSSFATAFQRAFGLSPSASRRG